MRKTLLRLRPTNPREYAAFVKRLLAVSIALVLASTVAAAFVSACAENGGTRAVPLEGADGSSEGGRDADGAAIDTGTEEDASVPSTCERTRAYVTKCNEQLPDGGDELTCGDDKFDAWCDANDKAINSDTYRRAEAKCLTTANCDGNARRDCEYRSYATATPTNAQKQVVAAYCQTCEPADPTCASRKTTYDPTLGPASTDDVFVAAWELSDALDDEIRTKCTGAALDAGVGPDAATCLKQFANCSGGIYIDHLPDCPQ